MLSRVSQKLLQQRSPALQAMSFSACARAFPNEPTPSVHTSFPSPKTKEYIATMSDKTCTLAHNFPVDLEKSLGNIVADADGNKLLDIFTSIGTNAVGYNHPAMLAAADTELMQMTMATRTGVGINPIKEMG